MEDLRERAEAGGDALRHRHALYHTHAHRHAHARLVHVWQHHCCYHCCASDPLATSAV